MSVHRDIWYRKLSFETRGYFAYYPWSINGPSWIENIQDSPHRIVRPHVKLAMLWFMKAVPGYPSHIMRFNVRCLPQIFFKSLTLQAV